jgi:uncharacterized protein (DUF488 family)
MSPIIWTIGHSTRPLDEFLALLKAHHIQQLVDVRTIPRSRHNPQFNTEHLSKILNEEGTGYTHMPQLGGLRKPKKDSINTGWRNASFRGYADYMQTDEFWSALDELMADSRLRSTAIMCAEAVPWRCHRSLIADALMTRDWEVRHMMSEKKADPHRLTTFATVENGLVRYPTPNEAPRLFP